MNQQTNQLLKQKLTHWTDIENKEKLLRNENIDFENSDHIKPTGIWVSINNSWENWLEGNWDSWLIGKTKVEVILSDDINLFIIDSKHVFLEKWKELIGKDYEQMTAFLQYKEFHNKLKKQYDGVLMTFPCFYAHRMDIDCIYFYPWDCESVCVWNSNKVKFIEGNKK